MTVTCTEGAKKNWLTSDSVELWTPKRGRFVKKSKRKRLKVRTENVSTGRGRRKIKLRVGE